MGDAIFFIWVIGGLVTFGVFCWADVVRGPRIDGWLNLAAAVIWPVVFVGYLFDRVRSSRR